MMDEKDDSSEEFLDRVIRETVQRDAWVARVVDVSLLVAKRLELLDEDQAVAVLLGCVIEPAVIMCGGDIEKARELCLDMLSRSFDQFRENREQSN